MTERQSGSDCLPTVGEMPILGECFGFLVSSEGVTLTFDEVFYVGCGRYGLSITRVGSSLDRLLVTGPTTFLSTTGWCGLTRSACGLEGSSLG